MCNTTEEPSALDVSAELYPDETGGRGFVVRGVANSLDRTHQLLKGYNVAGPLFSFFCIYVVFLWHFLLSSVL
jgi:hypothetical protein